MNELPVIDYVLGTIVLVSALLGLWRGLFREVFSLATWAAALIAGALFAPLVGEELLAGVQSPMLRTALGFLMVFMGTLIVGGLVSRLVGLLIDSTGLTGTDRLLGMLFGIGRGAVVTVVVVVLLRPIAHTYDWWQASAVVPLAEHLQDELGSWISVPEPDLSPVRAGDPEADTESI